VELFEEIRREYRFGVGTIQGVAKKLNTHRRMVRQALASAIPPERKTPARSSPKLGPVREFIDGILHSDREAPRKQRHTARRIWLRIGQEHFEVRVAEATVRRYVRRRKQELGVAARETFVPQSYDWGVEAQVDWYEAAVQFEEGRQVTYFFTMRSMRWPGRANRLCSFWNSFWSGGNTLRWSWTRKFTFIDRGVYRQGGGGGRELKVES